MSLFKRIAKFLSAATLFRNPAGNVTVTLTNALTTTTEYVEFAADTLVGVTGTRIRIYKPAANTDKAAELIVGATVIGTWTQTGYTVAAGAISGGGIVIEGTSSPKLRVAETSGAVYAELQVDGTSAYIGTVSNHPTLIRSNGVVGMRIAATEVTVGEGQKTVNFFERTAQGLSPSPSATYPQIFLTPNTTVLESPSDYNTYLLCNSYFDGTDFRALAAGEGVELVAGATGYRWQTAPSVAAGAAQTWTSRDGQPNAGRQWSNLTGSRAVDTVYQNTTGYEIAVSISITHSATSSMDIKVDTASPPTGIVGRSSPLTLNSIAVLAAIIPNLAYYELDTIAAGATILNWMELR